MSRWVHKGSYTVEASIYIPLILFIVMHVLVMGIDFFQESRNREISERIQKLDILREFYNYQILGEIGEELTDDK